MREIDQASLRREMLSLATHRALLYGARPPMQIFLCSLSTSIIFLGAVVTIAIDILGDGDVALSPAAPLAIAIIMALAYFGNRREGHRTSTIFSIVAVEAEQEALSAAAIAEAAGDAGDLSGAAEAAGDAMLASNIAGAAAYLTLHSHPLSWNRARAAAARAKTAALSVSSHRTRYRQRE